MNVLSSFYNDTFNCIKELFPEKTNPDVAFGNGTDIWNPSGTNRDYAALRNDNAVFFANVIKEHSDMFGIKKEDIKIQTTHLFGGGNRYRHSCYPKNIYRWRNGTLSRKRLCRVEYVTLLYCWAVNWAECDENSSSAIAAKLRSVSAKYAEHTSEEDDLLISLWKGCETAYKKTIIGSKVK